MHHYKQKIATFLICLQYFKLILDKGDDGYNAKVDRNADHRYSQYSNSVLK